MSSPVSTVSPENLLSSVIRITEQRSRETLEQCLVSTLMDLTDMARVGILRPISGGRDLLLECVAHVERDGTPFAPGTTLRLAECPLVEQALDADAEAEGVVDGGAHRRVLPIDGDAGPQAFLVADSAGDDSHHVGLLRGFAAIYRNYLGLLGDAARDTLTGLKNRKTFDENINRIIAAARHLSAAAAAGEERRQHALDESHWLGICDIDHFKRVNDTFGHVFGDEVLLLFAGLMKKTFRASDLLFRFGGEEFVVVLAPCTREQAGMAFERFRAAVEEFAFPQVGRVTTSVGYARIRPEDIAVGVIGQADTALYWAKNHGRNRVCNYEFLMAEGEVAAASEEGSAELF
jgi:diguanylate cyclase (GGDEF)-like protein